MGQRIAPAIGKMDGVHKPQGNPAAAPGGHQREEQRPEEDERQQNSLATIRVERRSASPIPEQRTKEPRHGEKCGPAKRMDDTGIPIERGFWMRVDKRPMSVA